MRLLPLLILLTSPAALLAQGTFNYVDFSGWTNGQTSGSAPWPSFGTVSANVNFFPNSDGQTGTNGNVWPRPANTQGDLAPFGPGLNPGLGVAPGEITNGGGPTGLTVDFTFNGGATFPTNAIFYAGDLDKGAIQISASLGGVPVNTGNWYSNTVQTASAGFGGTQTWDPVTSTLTGPGMNSEFFVSQFVPTGAYDTLTFLYESSPSDRIIFNIGDNFIVPEPGSVLLAGVLLSASLLIRRRS